MLFHSFAYILNFLALSFILAFSHVQFRLISTLYIEVGEKGGSIRIETIKQLGEVILLDVSFFATTDPALLLFTAALIGASPTIPPPFCRR